MGLIIKAQIGEDAIFGLVREVGQQAGEAVYAACVCAAVSPMCSCPSSSNRDRQIDGQGRQVRK